jgi:hypothetical protein
MMDGYENSVAMCTRCHAVTEMPAGEAEESVLDKIITLGVSAIDRILTLAVRAVFGRLEEEVKVDPKDPFLVRWPCGKSGLGDLSRKHDEYLYGKMRGSGPWHSHATV